MGKDVNFGRYNPHKAVFVRGSTAVPSLEIDIELYHLLNTFDERENTEESVPTSCDNPRRFDSSKNEGVKNERTL